MTFVSFFRRQSGEQWRAGGGAVHHSLPPLTRQPQRVQLHGPKAHHAQYDQGTGSGPQEVHLLPVARVSPTLGLDKNVYEAAAPDPQFMPNACALCLPSGGNTQDVYFYIF